MRSRSPKHKTLLVYYYSPLLSTCAHLPYLHLFSTIPGPCSSYSFLLIQSWWKVPRLANMLAPSHPPNLLSTVLPGAVRRTRGPGYMLFSSVLMRSVKPNKRDEPPVTITLFSNIGRSSMSTLLMELLMSWGIERSVAGSVIEESRIGFGVLEPGASGRMRDGLNMASVSLNRSEPTFDMYPSGNSKGRASGYCAFARASL